MNTKTAIRKIRIMLGAEEFEMQKTLVDGTRVSVETEFEPGVQLSVVTSDGLVPAPAGEHTTDDGITVVVDAAGVILEVSKAPVVALEDKDKEEKDKMEKDGKEKEKMEKDGKEDEEDEKMKDKSKKKMDEAEEMIVEKVLEAIAPLIKEVVEMKKEMEEVKKKFHAFSHEPAAAPIKNNFSDNQSNMEKRIAVLNQIRKTNKTK